MVLLALAFAVILLLVLLLSINRPYKCLYHHSKVIPFVKHYSNLFDKSMCKSFNKPTRCSLHTTLWVWMKKSEVMIQQINLTFVFALPLTIVHWDDKLNHSHCVCTHVSIRCLTFFCKSTTTLVICKENNL